MADDDTLTPLQQAQARANAYRLLGQLFLAGVSAELQPFLAQIGDLPQLSLSAEEAAARHQTIFRFHLFPNESIFLDTSNLLGGHVTEQVQLRYREGGYVVADQADHIGRQLDYVGFLSGAEADAWEDELPDVAVRMQRLQQAFVEAHLLRWLPALTVAIQQQGDPFYTAAADLVWQLLAHHTTSLSLAAVIDPFLPAIPALLDDETTSLKTIANYLATPALSGWWLGRHELTEIGRKLDLPRGFGGRVQMLMNLFRSATQFDGATTLLETLAERAKVASVAYGAMANDAPHVAAYVAVWQQRVAMTGQMLDHMQGHVAELQDAVA